MAKKPVICTGCAIVFIVTLIQHGASGNSDPSTIINVYPSLESIKKSESSPPTTKLRTTMHEHIEGYGSTGGNKLRQLEIEPPDKDEPPVEKPPKGPPDEEDTDGSTEKEPPEGPPDEEDTDGPPEKEPPKGPPDDDSTEDESVDEEETGEEPPEEEASNEEPPEKEASEEEPPEKEPPEEEVSEEEPPNEDQTEISDEFSTEGAPPDAESSEKPPDDEPARDLNGWEECDIDKVGSCVAASNIKYTWRTKDGRKHIRKAVRKVKFMKGEVEAYPFGTHNRMRKHHDHDHDHDPDHDHDHHDARTQEKSVVHHNWAEYQSLLQKLKKLKH